MYSVDLWKVDYPMKRSKVRKKAPAKKTRKKPAVKKTAPKKKLPTKPLPKKSRGFGRKVFPKLSEKENDKLRRLARDLAAAKAEVAKLKREKTKPKPKLKPKSQPEPTLAEKVKRLKRNVKYKTNTAFETERLNAKLAELNGQKIKVALSDDPNRLSKLAELEEQAIVYRRQRYRLSRPYFSERLIEFREKHRNGVDTFISACASIGMSEREAYTLWYSPK